MKSRYFRCPSFAASLSARSPRPQRVWAAGLSGFFLAIGALAQDPRVVVSNGPPLTLVERGGDYRLWRQITSLTNGQGQVSYQTNGGFDEIASGMHHLVNGQWAESTENIQVTPSGGAATHGQHQVNFAANINTAGAIDLTMPDNQHLRSHVIGLSYYDASQATNVLFALPKDCIGQVSGSNQVVYSGCFGSLQADLRYTYTRGGFEQDVILHEQPPDPGLWNLNAAATWLQVWTEFTNAPTPEITQTSPAADQYLNFGGMQMGTGRAFVIGNETASVPVRKRWVTIQGRNLLLEEIPLSSLSAQLQSLPPYSGGTNGGGGGQAMLGFPGKLPPPPKLAQAGTGGLKLASTVTPQKGLVLDYQAVTSQTNFTFKGDTTYYVSGAVTMSSNTTLEGGTVIKFTNVTSATITLNGPLICQTGPYRPAVLTSKNDNSVGATITGSTGSPNNTNCPAYFIGQSGQTNSYSYLRMLYAGTGITNTGAVTVWHSQFVQCGTAVASDGTGVINLYDALITQGTNCVYTTNTVVAVNVTGDQVQYFCGNTNYAGANVTNSIIAGVTNQSGVTPAYSVSGGSGLFQTVAGGQYYLASGSANRDAGTTNIPSQLLTDLQNRTTFPPVKLTTGWSTSSRTNLTLSPQAGRDTDTPDLGWHYDPLDYVWSNLSLSSLTLTFTNGVAVGVYGTNGLTVTSGSFVSQGSPLNLNRFCPSAVVQEQPLTAVNTLMNNPGSSAPSVTLRFTDLPMLGGSGYYLNITDTSAQNFGTLTLRDCQLRGGILFIEIGAGTDGNGNYSSMTVSLTNNLLERCASTFYRYYNYPPAFNLSQYNNLYHAGTLKIEHDSGYTGDTSPPTWHLHDNLFENISLTYAYSSSNYVDNDHNGFINNTVFSNSHGNDKTPSAADYQTGFLGAYYYPTNGTNLASLIDHGSRGADVAGLYHYTTTINQVKETNSTVDIGYHYVALNGNNQPDDTNNNGVPDYLEDANGNGTVNSGEIDWQSSSDLGLKVIITRPRNGSILP